METLEASIKPQVVVPDLTPDDAWTEVIQPHTQFLDLRLGEVWRYRDLVLMFVRRDLVSTYKQTILGPLWFFIQPLLTMIMYVFVFSGVAKLPTDGLPPKIFYLAGITVWNYFSQTLTNISTVFTTNAAIFGKVYFPRLTMPVSIVLSNILRFGIQFGLFLAFWLYYLITDTSLHPNWHILLTPLLLLIMGVLALGLGMIFSALTTKYRDLGMLLVFGIQLLMYGTPVIYPLSSITSPNRHLLFMANPMTAIVETFRYAYTGHGTFSWLNLGYSTGFAVVVLLIGTIIFNKVEKSFADTV